MKTNLKSCAKRLMALMLCVVFVVSSAAPSMVLAQEYDLPDWTEMEEIEPCAIVPPMDFDNFVVSHYSEQRLQDLLMRMGDFERLSSEEQSILREHLGIDDRLSPAEEAELRRELIEILSIDERESEINRFSALLSETANYSTLTGENRDFLFSQIGIADASAQAVDQLFRRAESEGLTFVDSVCLVRMVSSGIFNYDEARSVIHAIPSPQDRTREIGHFEWFASHFNIADTVNRQRLSIVPFVSVNEFPENSASIRPGSEGAILDNVRPSRPGAEPGLGTGINNEIFSEIALNPSPAAPPWLASPGRVSQTDDIWGTYEPLNIRNACETTQSLFMAFTSESAFNQARDMFLTGHRVAEINTAFALGAALELEPQSVMLQPGIYAAMAETQSINNQANQTWGQGSQQEMFSSNHQIQAQSQTLDQTQVLFPNQAAVLSPDGRTSTLDQATSHLMRKP